MIILPFSYADKRGWDSAHPAFSCKEILDSGHSKGDGEYWIDPEKSGNPLKVYCDMSRSGGKRMNFFWDTRTSTKVYLTWSSCYWNVLVLAIRAFSTKILIIMFWIKSIAEFSKVIGYHQPADLSTNRTVYALYLWLDGVIGPLKGQLTRHVCVSGQNASCAPCCLAFRRVHVSEWLIGNRTSCRQILSIMIRVINKSDSCFAFARFCKSLVWLQTELDSTRSCYHLLCPKF